MPCTSALRRSSPRRSGQAAPPFNGVLVEQGTPDIIDNPQTQTFAAYLRQEASGEIEHATDVQQPAVTSLPAAKLIHTER